MTDYKEYINALRKCAKEHEGDRTFTGQIIVSNLCLETANLLEELEQEPTTKNGLGVDAVSREEVLWLVADYDLSMGQVVKGIHALPSVTPQPRKGHWKLVQRGKYIDICCSNCEAIRVKGCAYNYTIDQLDKEDVKDCFESDDMRYCPYCGAKMVEPQESEE